MSRPLQPDQNAIRAFVAECFEGTGAPDSVLDQAAAFLAGWCSLPVQQQFCLQQRAFGKEHEAVAREFRAVFHQPITPAGISASCTAAATQAQAALAPGLSPTTSAPPTAGSDRGTSANADRKSVNRQTPPPAPV